MSIKKNIAFLLGGTALAQVFTFAISPILTRLYTPNDFGILGIVLSASSIIAVAAHLRLNLAIALASSIEKAKVILKIAVILSLVICFLASGGIYSYAKITQNTHYSFLIVCLIFIVALLNTNIDTLNYWQSYRQRFKESAQRSVIRSLSTGFFQIALSLITPLGLILGVVIGAFSAIVLYIREIYKASEHKIKAPITLKLIKNNIVKYKTFPLYSMPQGFLASASLNAVPIILSSAYGLGVAGQYWLAYRILLAPIALFGGAYRQVLHPILSNSQTNIDQKIKIARKHTLLFFSILTPIMVVFFVLAEIIFKVIFGEAWIQAGQFASWLVLCFSLDIVKIPSICIVHALQLHKKLLVFEILIGIIRVMGLLITTHFFSALISIEIFAIISTFFTLIVIYNILFRKIIRINYEDN